MKHLQEKMLQDAFRISLRETRKAEIRIILNAEKVIESKHKTKISDIS